MGITNQESDTMRFSMITLTATLVLAGATSAFAAQVTGTITQVNTRADSITLDTGNVFMLPEGIEAETLKVVERVTITYATTNAGKTRVSTIRQAK
jgi:hypothetical protein